MKISNSICIDHNALSVELCNDIIDIFETNETKSNPAGTLGGVQPNILNAKSISCYSIDAIDHPDWPRIQKSIEKITINKVTQYQKKLVNLLDISGNSFAFFDEITWKGFSVNKYSAVEKGHYTYHTDRHTILDSDEERVITFLYYLQDVETGGETCFPGQGLKVKPEAGKLVFFPSTWTYPHCSLPTVSNDKYIIVGWFLAKHFREPKK
jgi:hypothetical protein